MKNVQNIFMDQKSYELIQDRLPLQDIISVILDNIDTTNPKPQSITIDGIEFDAEFHPKNDYFGFTFTGHGNHYIDHTASHFANSVYIYSPTAMNGYDKDFSGITLLFYTTKRFIYAIPEGESSLSKMDCSTGEFTQRLQYVRPLLSFTWHFPNIATQ